MSDKAAEHNYRMALMFYRTERYEDAMAILDDLALEFPDSKHVLYALAKCFAKVGRYQEARALCQELAERHQDERAATLLERIGDRPDSYIPQNTFQEAPPELPPDIGVREEGAAEDSSTQAATPASDTTSSWMSSTPAGLMYDSSPEKESSYSSAGSYSTPLSDAVTPFITPPPLSEFEEKPVPGPSTPPALETTPVEEPAKKPFISNGMIAVIALALAGAVLILWVAFGPRQFVFPDDHTMGTLVIREIDGSHVRWRDYGAAQGQTSFPKWEYIGLNASPELTEADLVLLQKASWLKQLDLSKSNVTDEMIDALAELRQLRVLDVRDTQLSEEGIARLRKWLPDCTLRFDVASAPKPAAAAPAPVPVATAAPKPSEPPAPAPAPKAPTPKPPEPVTPATPPGPRELIFADMVGDVQVKAWDALDSTDWKSFQPAKGRVVVPAERIVKLVVKAGSAQLRAIQLLSPDDLHSLDVSAARLEDDAAPIVARFTGLRSLLADDAQITNKGLTQLCALTGLRELSLAGADKYDAAGMAKFSALTSLERLTLRGGNVNDECLQHLAGLTALRRLDLSRTAVSDAGLASLAKLSQLTELNLSHTQVSGPGLVHLQALRSLQRLDLAGNSINEEGLQHLAQCRHLQFIQMDGPDITDASILVLAQIPTLRQVNLANTGVSAEGAAALKKAMPGCSVLLSKSRQ
ncbi:MAG TPA: tetratricopeptide repeat protein [Candidatus Hydrogenedentes bacterium]|nr:tetratricopeptide repeat protein [Candidatus Hydrogenedentota bacterium]HPJ98099.1 tetratricopeptide repeat protein [Candidatus Hydrogenedentota bacterium]